jgi:hypothetical protein
MPSPRISFPAIAAIPVALVAFILALSCATGPKTVPVTPQTISTAPTPAPEAAPPEPAPAPAAPTPFDPSAVPAEIKIATIVDVSAFIEGLNQIVRMKDFEEWRKNLTDEYISYYSDKAVLDKYSEYPVLKRNGVKLQSLKDFFMNVVYPSHQNDKIDDIEFVGENMIKAITVSPKGDRNILYMLEKHGDAWMIGIGR